MLVLKVAASSCSARSRPGLNSCSSKRLLMTSHIAHRSVIASASGQYTTKLPVSASIPTILRRRSSILSTTSSIRLSNDTSTSEKETVYHRLPFWAENERISIWSGPAFGQPFGIRVMSSAFPPSTLQMARKHQKRLSRSLVFYVVECYLFWASHCSGLRFVLAPPRVFCLTWQ